MRTIGGLKMRRLSIPGLIILLMACSAKSGDAARNDAGAAVGDSVQTGAVAPSPTAAGNNAPAAANLLELANGTIILSASANPGEALSLTDGADATSWHNAGRRDGLPYSFVVELKAPAVLTAVGVRGAGPQPGGAKGAAAKIVSIEASAAGPSDGFVRIAAFDAAAAGESMAPVTGGKPFRWLRYTVASNHGNEIWTYVSAVIARGRQDAVGPVDFTGSYRTGRTDVTRLSQQGAAIAGCYTEQGGKVTGRIAGAIEDGAARIQWISDKGITGTAFFVIDSRKRLNGVRYRDRSRFPWTGDKTDATGQDGCTLSSPDANPISLALKDAGRAVIYGILFDFDKATLRPEARPALDQLLAALKQDQQLGLAIEGHTDAMGEDRYNLDLSTRRAQSVAAWLAERGIAANRLVPGGKGEAVPVASNDTADGRALNRRVEVVRR
jgi:outer membrane protein OmpA-like peptidoglycan-associated protein